jgi:hypothetical protein
MHAYTLEITWDVNTQMPSLSIDRGEITFFHFEVTIFSRQKSLINSDEPKVVGEEGNA